MTFRQPSTCWVPLHTDKPHTSATLQCASVMQEHATTEASDSQEHRLRQLKHTVRGQLRRLRVGAHAERKRARVGAFAGCGHAQSLGDQHAGLPPRSHHCSCGTAASFGTRGFAAPCLEAPLRMSVHAALRSDSLSPATIGTTHDCWRRLSRALLQGPRGGRQVVVKMQRRFRSDPALRPQCCACSVSNSNAHAPEMRGNKYLDEEERGDAHVRPVGRQPRAVGRLLVVPARAELNHRPCVPLWLQHAGAVSQKVIPSRARGHSNGVSCARIMAGLR